jgi:hypothetical protein
MRALGEGVLFHHAFENDVGSVISRDGDFGTCYISDMLTKEILAIVDRIQTWPADKQQLAYDLLTWIEDKDEDDASDLTEEDWADLEEGLAEADRGEFASEEELKALFDRYR